MSDPDNPFNEPPDVARARRWRSIAIAVSLAAFVILVFVVTLVKVKGHVVDPSF